MKGKEGRIGFIWVPRGSLPPEVIEEMRNDLLSVCRNRFFIEIGGQGEGVQCGCLGYLNNQSNKGRGGELYMDFTSPAKWFRTIVSRPSSAGRVERSWNNKRATRRIHGLRSTETV
ncbi:hypothetical protein AAHE18_05G212800 [Arachis hypogaea]